MKNWKAFPKQQEFLDAYFTGQYRFMCFGGAIKGGKTDLGINLLQSLAKIFPGSRWAIVRRTKTLLKQNTYPLWKKNQLRGWEFSEYYGIAKYKNGSEIIFIAADITKDRELEDWRGLDVNGFLFEEGNEVSVKYFYKAIERAGSWNALGGIQPDPLIMITCNPSQSWVKDIFYTPFEQGKLDSKTYFLQSYPSDNPFNPQTFLDNLEELKVKSPNDYNKFVLGDWHASEDPDQLIKYEWITQCYGVPQDIDRFSCDPARYGDDKIKIGYGNHQGLKLIKTIDNADTTEIAQQIANDMDIYKINNDMGIIDTVGLGAGVYDALKHMGHEVKEFVGGASPVENYDVDNLMGDTYKFKNLRSQAHWLTREALREEAILIPDDPELRNEALAIKYKISEKVIEIESKDKIKQRIGKSPDTFDMLTMFTMIELVSAQSWGYVI